MLIFFQIPAMFLTWVMIFFKHRHRHIAQIRFLFLPMSGIIIQTVFDKKLMMFYSYLQDPDRTLHDWVIMSDDKRMEIDRGEQ